MRQQLIDNACWMDLDMLDSDRGQISFNSIKEVENHALYEQIINKEKQEETKMPQGDGTGPNGGGPNTGRGRGGC